MENEDENTIVTKEIDETMVVDNKLVISDQSPTKLNLSAEEPNDIKERLKSETGSLSMSNKLANSKKQIPAKSPSEKSSKSSKMDEFYAMMAAKTKDAKS